MKKAASIFLRAEINPQDVKALIRWMGNPQVTRYLHEEADVVQTLRRVLVTVPAPMLTFQFNQWGRFFMVCVPDGSAIGFVKLKALSSSPGAYEIVDVIGEEALWGNGYGEGTIRSALFTAFLEWRDGKSLPRSAPGTSVRTCSPILRIPKGRNGRAAPPIQYYHGRLSAEAAGDLIHIGLLGTLPMMRWRWTSLFQ